MSPDDYLNVNYVAVCVHEETGSERGFRVSALFYAGMKGEVWMRIEDIRRMAYDVLEKGSIENDYIEYKKSAAFKNKI